MTNKLENLGTDQKMEVRNNTIIKLLEETTDIVENRHTGIATMREEMRKANLPGPEFETLRGTFKVTFWKENSKMTDNNCTDNCVDCVDNCVDNELKLLVLLKKMPNITQLQIANELNVSKRTVSTLLSKLKNNNKIRRIGSSKSGYWKVL